MYLKVTAFCTIVGVFGMYAMENENKAEGENKIILKHQPLMDKSPQIKKVKTLEDIEKTFEKDEFKYARRRSRSLENIDPLDINFDSLLTQSATLAIKELDTTPANSIRKYRSMSSQELKKSSSNMQLPNLSLLKIK